MTEVLWTAFAILATVLVAQLLRPALLDALVGLVAP